MESNPPNLDRATVDDFGREWRRFDQRGVSSAELERMFAEYFAIFQWDSLPRDAVGFDAGCGSGRWACLVAPRVGWLHCIDASADALAVPLEIGRCRTSRRLRLLAVGAGRAGLRAAWRQYRQLAARRLSLAQLLCDAHRRARPLRHTRRASHDASPDRNSDGKSRAARH